MAEQMDAIEAVLMTGDLKGLNPDQRLAYYKNVCQSLGLNPLTRPFDYITLNGKLTLYARKDAADQLRKVHSVSIERPEITYVDDLIVVSIAGHTPDGRTDSEIGAVSRKDMGGNVANALMKAVTKAKRRLTLSICGLGWLDETEVETIPEAKMEAEQKELPEPQPKSKPPAPVEAQRPYPPDAVRAKVHGLIASEKRPAWKTGIVTPEQVRDLAIVLSAAVKDEGDSARDVDDKRHSVLVYLTGKASSKELTMSEADAVLQWLRSINGQYAADEAHLIARDYEREAEQNVDQAREAERILDEALDEMDEALGE